MRSHREDEYRLPEGVRPITHRLKDVGYYTSNLKTMNGEEIGSGKLDLNFVNEGKLYDGSKWEDLKNNQPFFAQMNTLECEYDIYDRNTCITVINIIFTLQGIHLCKEWLIIFQILPLAPIVQFALIHKI